MGSIQPSVSAYQAPSSTLPLSPSEGARSHQFVPYRHTPTDQMGFCRHLIQQGRVHGHMLELGHARAVSNSIGQEINVVLLKLGEGSNERDIQGMYTFTEMDTIHGRKRILEDIIINEESRRQGYGTMLYAHFLLSAWEKEGIAGVTWETSRSNFPAHKLFARFDPTFHVDGLHDVWQISNERGKGIVNEWGRVADIATLNHVLAYDHLGTISDTLRRQEGKDIGHLSKVIRQQGISDKADSVVVIVPETGSFAIASKGSYSTFDACKRFIVRPYFGEGDVRDDMGKLIKAVCKAKEGINFPGSIYVEFTDSMDGSNKDNFDKTPTGKAMRNLGAMGANVLTHDETPMVACNLFGESFVRAVARANSELPNHLTRSAQAQLKRMIRRYDAQEQNLVEDVSKGFSVAAVEHKETAAPQAAGAAPKERRLVVAASPGDGGC